MAPALTALAAVLVRATDWRKPTEADAPELDQSDLQTNLNLDEIFGTDEKLDARDPLPS